MITAVRNALSIILIIAFSAVTNGFIVYCPCMGRFGNQVDQFLGTLRFAKSVNRTLVLPPWIDYVHFEVKFRPFDSIFKIEEIRKYHHVISMEEFMRDIAPSAWPVGSRKVFCYYYRNNEKNDCAAKDGSPFGNFWNHFDVSFDESITYGPLAGTSSASDWISRFPQQHYPVLAFVGAVGSFPIQYEDTFLHKYLAWTDKIDSSVKNIISSKMVQPPFVAIHLRNDRDFDDVCKLLKGENGMTSLFDSAQCHGYDSKTKVTMDQCSPTNDLILNHVRQAMKRANARALYVSTDRDDLSSFLQSKLGSLITHFASSRQLNTPVEIDLAMLGRADAAVLNCVSSFSAFARRERDLRQLSTDYFGFTPIEKSQKVEL